MNKKFQSILDRHEKEDRDMICSEADIVREMRKELANCDELLALLQANDYPVRRFFADDSFPREYPIVPLRQSDEFGVHKHTVCSRPYFHDHTFYELVYVIRGECVQNFPGRSVPLVLHEKQLCLLRPGAVHLIERCGEDDAIIKIVIPPPLFYVVAEPLAQGNEKIEVYARTNEQVGWCVSRLLDESVRGDEHAASAIKSYLTLLFIELKRVPTKSDDGLSLRLEAYLNKHIARASLTDFAAALGYSEGYAGRLLKKKLGKSFSEIVSAARLGKAAELLANTELSVEDVASEVGYLSASGLYKQFSGVYGVRPGDYRKMFR